MTRAKDERGQAMVEFVLVLPLFLGLVFLAIGFGITLNNYLRVTDVARVAARAASIARFGGQPESVRGRNDCGQSSGIGPHVHADPELARPRAGNQPETRSP